ncbi:MAG: hypothetical protein FWF88_12755, partial [Peptococcaceae bacterium]|nr:hypothetical protein [Peptococcaceae bacterium]
IAAINEITQRCLILYNKLENLLHELEEIKNNHFDPFDKFDAEIADRTLGFYSTHVDADFIKQLEEEEIIYGSNYNAETFEKTVVDGIVGAGELLWGGIKTLGMLGAANWAAWTDNMDNVPAWADEQADKTVDGIDGMITFLDDPGRAGHNIAAGIEDSMAREYDENGIMAVTAVVGGMVVDPLAALGKAGKGAKFYKRLRNGETVLMTAQEVNNLKRRVTVIRNMDEVLAKKRLAGAGKIDDIAQVGCAENTLPNVEKVTVDSRKVTDYALNPNNLSGGADKARVFENALGYNQLNFGQLIEQIQSKLPSCEAVLGKADQYGQRFTVDIPITGPNGNTANVRTGWILEPGSDTPRMTTLFVKD